MQQQSGAADHRKKLLLVNLYPQATAARYLLSSYLLKAYVDAFPGREEIATKVVNFPASADPGEISAAILSEQPHFVGYSCYVWNMDRIVGAIRAVKGKKDFVHILGGPEISLTGIRTLPGWMRDAYYVIGEGERAMVRLLRFLSGERGGLPPGVAMFSDDGGVAFTPDGERIRDLDEIPSAYATGAVDDALYRGKQAFLETQRGCRFRCRYCLYHKNLPSVSAFSLERVLGEIDHLVVRKKVMALRILDAVFTHDLGRAKSIVRHLAGLKDAGARLPWLYWEFTHDTVDEEFLDLVARLNDGVSILNSGEVVPLDFPQLYREMLRGYAAINCVGVQSLNVEALKAAGRRQHGRGELAGFMSLARGKNIALKIDLILGLPFETLDSYFEGLDFLLPFFRDTDHILNIHRLKVLPGSELAGLGDTYGIRYSAQAPHNVIATNTLSEKDMEYALRLSALLFRVVNSPLRGAFFAAQSRWRKNCRASLEEILRRLPLRVVAAKPRLTDGEPPDDDYWNDAVFKEVPSKLLAELLST